MSNTSFKQKAEAKPETAGNPSSDQAGGATESERLLHLVTDRSPVSIAYCGADRTYKFANKLYAERFGLLPQDIVGRTIGDVFGKEAYASFEPYVEAALGGRRVEFERKERSVESGIRYAWVNYEPVYDDSGHVIGFV